MYPPPEEGVKSGVSPEGPRRGQRWPQWPRL